MKPVYHAERKEVWTGEQLATLLEGTKDHWLGPLFMTAACSGCRISELVGLRWEDVDLVRGTLFIRRGLHRIGREWVEAAPKSRAGVRSVVLPQEAGEALRRQKRRQAEQRLRLGPAWQDRGLVFPGEKGQPLHRSVVFHALGRECKRLGLPHLGPHQLRHAHASLLLAQGLPIAAVSQRLGHANPAITMSVYAHALKRQDEEAAEAIGKVLAHGKVATMA